jgi:hypothetical protein
MSIKDFFIKQKSPQSEDAKKSNTQYAPKWIMTSFDISTSNEMTKDEVNKVAEDMALIVNNTHGISNTKNEFIGFINPYLNIDCISTADNQVVMCNQHSALIDRTVSKTFIPTVFELTDPAISDTWQIILAPYKAPEYNEVDLYSIDRLDNDMYMLAGASNFICNRYGISIGNEKPIDAAIVKNDIPLIRHSDHLIVHEYNVLNRLECAQNNPDLDKSVLGSGHYTIFEFIDEVKRNKKHDPIWMDWLQKLDKHNSMSLK